MRKGGDRVTVERIVCLATAALVAMLILAPASLAGAEEFVAVEKDLVAEEQEATVVEHEMLEQTPDELIDEPGGPAPKEGTQPKGGSLPKSGGAMTPSALLLPVAALLLGSGVLGYAVLWRRG
jgi:hypothetical protein